MARCYVRPTIPKLKDEFEVPTALIGNEEGGYQLTNKEVGVRYLIFVRPYHASPEVAYTPVEISPDIESFDGTTSLNFNSFKLKGTLGSPSEARHEVRVMAIREESGRCKTGHTTDGGNKIYPIDPYTPSGS